MVLRDANPPQLRQISTLERLIDVGYQLKLGLSLERAQELYFSCLHSQIARIFKPSQEMVK